ncbi:MAG: aKG-HExxH-type peptide beta-hydroxylase [Bacteroidia bacterium]
MNKSFPKSKAWVEYFAALVQNTLEDCLIKSKNREKLKKFIDTIKHSDKTTWLKYLYNPVVVNWCSINSAKEYIFESDIEFLFDNLHHQSYPIAIHRTSVNILSTPPPIIIQNLRTFGIGSKGSDSSNANSITDIKTFFEYKSKILESIDYIKKHTPGFYRDFCTFITSIVLVDEHASFRGASSISNIGLIFFSPENQWSEITWAEEIIHETTHNILDVVSVREPLLLGEDSYLEKYDAPFRKDKRHLYGNFHALCVISRLIQFHTCLISSGVNIKFSKEKIEEYRIKASEPYKALLSDACFSGLGKALHDLIIKDTLK